MRAMTDLIASRLSDFRGDTGLTPGINEEGVFDDDGELTTFSNFEIVAFLSASSLASRIASLSFNCNSP